MWVQTVSLTSLMFFDPACLEDKSMMVAMLLSVVPCLTQAIC